MQIEEWEDLKDMLSTLPMDLQRRILVTSIVDDKNTPHCERVEHLCKPAAIGEGTSP